MATQPDEYSNVPSQPHSLWATRSSMIADLKKASPERWTSFVLVYTPMLKFWIVKKNVSPSVVDDILQESLKSIFTGMTCTVMCLRGARMGSMCIRLVM